MKRAPCSIFSMVFVLTFFVLWNLLIGCSPREQSALQTEVAKAGKTAVAEGAKEVQTQAAQAAQTAFAEAAKVANTRVAQVKQTAEAELTKQIGKLVPGREIDYFALGDSIASGHGLDNGGDIAPCYRSTRAYPKLVEASLKQRYVTVNFPADHFLACSGASALDPGSAKKNEHKYKWLRNQVDDLLVSLSQLLPDRLVLVSITIGANDFKWADPINFLWRLNEPSDTYFDWVNSTSAKVKDEVRSQVDRILSRPNVVVVITDYPNPFNEESRYFKLKGVTDCGDLLGVLSCYEKTKYGIQALNNTLFLDLVLPLKSNRAGFAFVYEAFGGHNSPKPSCGNKSPDVGETWIQYFGDPNSKYKVDKGLRDLIGIGDQTGDCFHPNQKGAGKYGEAVNAAAQKLGR